MEKKHLIYLLTYLTSTIMLVNSQIIDKSVSTFDNPTDCGNRASDWKPCINRQLADNIFIDCCEKNLPKQCRNACVYETFPGDAQLTLMKSIQPNKCRLYVYLSVIVNCAAQKHNNSECCRDMGVNEINDKCLNLCQPQPKKHTFWGVTSLKKEYVQCLTKWDQILQCHQAGLRARNIIKLKST